MDNKVSLSQEGIDALRFFAKEAKRVVALLVEDTQVFFTAALTPLSSLGDLQEEFDSIVKEVSFPLKTICEDVDDLAEGMLATAAQIEDYLKESLEADIETIAYLNPDVSVSADLAINGDSYVAGILEHANSSFLDSVRDSAAKEGTTWTHRHPATRGEWLDENHNPLANGHFNNKGTYYWRPDPNAVFKGKRVGDILKKYDISEIEFRDGYPNFPPQTILLEIGLTDLLSAKRSSNFAEAGRIVIEDALLGTQGALTTPEFNNMVAAYMAKLGKPNKWFENKTQVKQFISDSKLTWHEREDMATMQLIPQEVHSLIAHDGGVSNAKLRDSEARDMRLLYKAAASIVMSKSDEI